MTGSNIPVVPVSWGELLDKMTILDIKRLRIPDPVAQAHIRMEQHLLREIGAPVLSGPDVRRALRRLRRVNQALWTIEDRIRQEEATASFGPCFIRLARSVYRMNDRRAAIKREINLMLKSHLMEEKSYTAAMPAGRATGRATP